MSDLKHAELMLGKAEIDLKALRAMMDAEQFADEVFGFHAQQAVEKSLKAWLSLVGTRYPRVHDLDALIDLLEVQGIDVAELREVSDLSAFAVEFRYEQAADALGSRGRATTIRQVAAILERVRVLVAQAS